MYGRQWRTNHEIKPAHDSTINRKNELSYQDKTLYAEKVASIVTDYYNLTRYLLDLAISRNASNEEINKILNKYGTSYHRIGQKRKCESLLTDRFEIQKLIRIQ